MHLGIESHSRRAKLRKIMKLDLESEKKFRHLGIYKRYFLKAANTIRLKKNYI